MENGNNMVVPWRFLRSKLGDRRKEGWRTEKCVETYLELSDARVYAGALPTLPEIKDKAQVCDGTCGPIITTVARRPVRQEPGR
jgi:hypothetical protein